MDVELMLGVTSQVLIFFYGRQNRVSRSPNLSVLATQTYPVLTNVKVPESRSPCAPATDAASSLKFYQTFAARPCTFISVPHDFSSVCFGSFSQPRATCIHPTAFIRISFFFFFWNISIYKNECRHNLHVPKSNHEGLWYLEVIKIDSNQLHKMSDDSLDRLGIKRV